MKFDIISIFDDRLYACKFEGCEEDEYHRLLKLWDDAEYLYDFFDENKKYFDTQYFKARSKNGEYDIYDFLDEVEEDFNTHMEIYLGLEKQTLDIDNVFEDLGKKDYSVCGVLSLKKKKFIRLRFYAIQIEKGLYLITGGAIKIVKAMQDHYETKNQLAYLKAVEQCLTHEGVKCSSQFYELLKFKESIRK